MYSPVQTTPFSLKEKLLNRLWSIVNRTVFRFSPFFMRKLRVFMIRSFGAKVDYTCSLDKSCLVNYPWNLEMGAFSSLAENACLSCDGHVRIGQKAFPPMIDLTVIILTKNEQKHIRRCLENVLPIAREIIVIDCFSTDETAGICSSYDRVRVIQHEWPGTQAAQLNWALDHVQINTEWVLRLDADEYLPEDAKIHLQHILPSMEQDVSALSLLLRRHFLGKPIKHGLPPIRLVRIFRKGKARSEVRAMDEHMVIQEGRVWDLDAQFVDDNLNNLSWWTGKHVGYAIREAAQLLDQEYGLSSPQEQSGSLSGQTLKKRAMKRTYARLPLFWRGFAYFCYRYILRLGFLDGREGFLWHFLQGWWYRTLVDAKIMEIKKACGEDPASMKSFLKTEYGIALD